jgi:hypothetical protein
MEQLLDILQTQCKLLVLQPDALRPGRQERVDLGVLMSRLYPQYTSRSIYLRLNQALMDHVVTMTDAQLAYPLYKEIIVALFTDASQNREDAYYKFRKQHLRKMQESEMKEYALSVFKTSRSDKQASKTKANAQRDKRLTNKLAIPLSSVLLKIQNALTSGMFSRQVLGLQLACGARSIEIVSHSVSDFSSNHEDRIQQSGVAKNQEQPIVIDKPLLGCTATQFLDVLKQVRGVTRPFVDAGETNNELRRLTVGSVLAAKDYFPAAVSLWKTGVGTHLARAIYVNAAYHQAYGTSSTTMDHTTFVQQTLGHSCILSNYNTIVITEEKEEEEMVISLPVRYERYNEKFVVIDGVSLLKFRPCKMTPFQQRERLLTARNMLLQANLDPSKKNVRRLGIGSRNTGSPLWDEVNPKCICYRKSAN